jgi:hypothetical protein
LRLRARKARLRARNDPITGKGGHKENPHLKVEGCGTQSRIIKFFVGAKKWRVEEGLS